MSTSNDAFGASRTPPSSGADANLGLTANRRRMPLLVAAQIEAKLIAGLALLIAVTAISLVVPTVVGAPYIFERNYNEGWNVYNTIRSFGEEPLYDGNFWRVANYPPLSFWLVGGLSRLFGSPLVAGRIVSLAAFAAVGVAAATVIRAERGTPPMAAFGAAAALGYCFLAAPGWIGTDDPQTLAEALMLAGFAIHVRWPGRHAALAAAAACVVAAGFTKHSLIAIPFAITLDLACRQRRLLPYWLGLCAGLAVALLLLVKVAAGGDMIGHLLSPRRFDWWHVHYHAMKFARLFKLPLLALPLGALFGGTPPRPVLAWGLAALASAALMSGAAGTSYNMFQDSAVFLGVAGALILQRLRETAPPRNRLAPIAAALLLAAPFFGRLPDALSTLSTLDQGQREAAAAQDSFLADARYVAGLHGPALCESLLLCYEAGQDFLLDPFNSRQYVLAGRLDETPLLDRIARGEFVVIELRGEICDDGEAAHCVIRHDPRKFERFTDAFLYAVARRYRIDRVSSLGVFYVPKPAEDPSARPFAGSGLSLAARN